MLVSVGLAVTNVRITVIVPFTVLRRLPSFYWAALFLAVMLAARADDISPPEVWRDPEKEAAGAIAKGPHATDAQAVRDQIAGVLDGWLAKPCLPYEFGQATIGGLPTFYMRGVLLVGPEDQSVLVTVSFADDRTLIGFVTTTGEDVEFNYVEKRDNISGNPHPAAAPVIKEVAEKLQRSLPELKRLVVANNREAVDKFRARTRQDETVVEIVKSKRGDLAQNETNAEALDRRLRALQPSLIYGWGTHRLSDTEQTVTFTFKIGDQTSMLVWRVHAAKGTCTNLSADKVAVEELRAKRELNLASDPRLMPYNPKYEMKSFRNSDYYRGRGTDPLGQPLK